MTAEEKAKLLERLDARLAELEPGFSEYLTCWSLRDGVRQGDPERLCSGATDVLLSVLNERFRNLPATYHERPLAPEMIGFAAQVQALRARLLAE